MTCFPKFRFSILRHLFSVLYNNLSLLSLAGLLWWPFHFLTVNCLTVKEIVQWCRVKMETWFNWALNILFIFSQNLLWPTDQLSSYWEKIFTTIYGSLLYSLYGLHGHRSLLPLKCHLTYSLTNMHNRSLISNQKNEAGMGYKKICLTFLLAIVPVTEFIYAYHVCS